MNDDKVTVATAASSIWYTDLGEAESYRVVGAACRITYTGPPLTASGRIRIWRLCGADMETGIGGAWPKSFGTTGPEFYDYSCAELSKGVTVFLYRMDPQSKVFEDISSLELGDCWQGFQLMALGLDASASLVLDWRQTIEYTPKCGTLSAQIASSTPASNPALDKVLGLTSQTMKVVNGPIQKVLEWGQSHIGKVAGQLIKSGAQSALKAGTQYALNTAMDSIISSLETDVGALMLI